MGRRLAPTERQIVRYNGNREPTAKTRRDANGNLKTDGCRIALKKTQAYPIGFGAMHALLFDRHCKHLVGSPPNEFQDTDDTSDSEIGEQLDPYMRDFHDPDFRWMSNIPSERLVES